MDKLNYFTNTNSNESLNPRKQERVYFGFQGWELGRRLARRARRSRTASRPTNSRFPSVIFCKCIGNRPPLSFLMRQHLTSGDSLLDLDLAIRSITSFTRDSLLAAVPSQPTFSSTFNGSSQGSPHGRDFDLGRRGGEIDSAVDSRPAANCRSIGSISSCDSFELFLPYFRWKVRGDRGPWGRSFTGSKSEVCG